MMIIVSDTSPIINLAQINLLSLLPKLYGQIIIPQAVYNEIVINGEKDPGAYEIKNAGWITVKSCEDTQLLNELLIELDKGEAEAIVLALELNADRILMDEQIGRHKAIELKLRPIGVLGILISAKQHGLIENVKPYVINLIKDAHFFIHPKLYEEVMKVVNE